MAITRVGTASNSGSGTSVIVDLTSIPLAAGDLILLIHGWEAQTDGTPAVITAGYTDLIADQFVNDTRDTNAAVSYKFADGSETQVEVAGVNSIADRGGALVTVYRGVDPTTPFDVTTVTAAGTNGNAINPNAITPATSGAKIVLLGIATSSISGITGPTAAPTGFGNLATVASPGVNRGYYACTADMDWSGGSVDPDSFTGQTTSTTSDSSFVATIALRPAAGAVTLAAGALAATGTGGAVSFVGSKTLSAGAIAATGAGGAVGLTVGRVLSASALAATGAGGAIANVGGAPSLPYTPTGRWHPEYATVTLSSGRVASATGENGPTITEGAAGIGPVEMTDLLGRKFWRFEGAEYMDVPTSFVANTRAVTVFFVGRIHRNISSNPILSLGNRNAATNTTTNNSTLDVALSSNGAPSIRCASTAGTSAASNAEYMIAGSQMQVLGAVSRDTANGGRRLAINEKFADLAQTSIAVSPAGAEIGRNAQTGTNYGSFDLYEIVVYDYGLTNSEFDAVAAALVSNWSIPELTDQLVLEGDSITQGTGTVTNGISSGMILSDPGRDLIPANWRVVNMGVSGATVATMTTRRDAATGWPNYTLPGQNVVAFEIGRNDMASVDENTHYANVVAYLNTATTGVLQRGWTARVLANIAAAPTIQAKIDPYRAMIRNAQFLIDTDSQTGGTYAGKVSIVGTDLIEDGGNTVFYDSTDATDTTYYQGDNTHPNPAGAVLRVTGGDDPTLGIAYGLEAVPGVTLTADVMSATGSGGAASLTVGRTLSVGSLAATGAGGSAAITAGRIVGAGALSASASGGSVALVIGRVISAGPLAAMGSGGAIADLAGSITLSAGALAASAAGHDASLLVGRVTLAAPLAAIGTGGVVALRVGRVLVAGRGSATGFGGAVTLVASGASGRRYAQPGEPNGVRLLSTGNAIAGFGG